jgi:hypothetical protein
MIPQVELKAFLDSSRSLGSLQTAPHPWTAGHCFREEAAATARCSRSPAGHDTCISGPVMNRHSAMIPGRLVAIVFVIGGCGGRSVTTTDAAVQVDSSASGLLSFCSGPAKVGFGDGAPAYPDTVTPRWTVDSGPASPEGGVAVSTRVWVQLFKASTWDWMTEAGITVEGDLHTPVRVDLAQLPSSWIAWIEHGLKRTIPDANRPYSSARGHLFRGWFELSGSLEEGKAAELSLCAVGTRADGSTIKVHVPPIRFWRR